MLVGSGSISGEQCSGRKGSRKEKRGKERERKERKRERKERDKKKLFEFSKLEFIPFLDFQIKISFLRNFDRVFDF